MILWNWLSPASVISPVRFLTTMALTRLSRLSHGKARFTLTVTSWPADQTRLAGNSPEGKIPSIAEFAVIRLRVRYERVPFNGDLRAARHSRDRAEVNVIGQLRGRVRKGVHGPDVDVCAAGLDRVVDDRAVLVKFIPV